MGGMFEDRCTLYTNGNGSIHVGDLRAAEEREAKMCDDRDDYRNLLKAVLDIEYECEIIGGGPGWQDRRKKAFRAARERFEP